MSVPPAMPPVVLVKTTPNAIDALNSSATPLFQRLRIWSKLCPVSYRSIELPMSTGPSFSTASSDHMKLICPGGSSRRLASSSPLSTFSCICCNCACEKPLGITGMSSTPKVVLPLKNCVVVVCATIRPWFISRLWICSVMFWSSGSFGFGSTLYTFRLLTISFNSAGPGGPSVVGSVPLTGIVTPWLWFVPRFVNVSCTASISSRASSFAYSGRLRVR